MKPTKKLWSHKSPSGHLSQIDYILIRKKWQNSVRNSQSFSSFSSIGSDHRIVSSKICLSLRVSKRPAPKPMKKIDWKNVVADKDLSSLYSITVKNRFDALSSSDDDINQTYNTIVKSVEEVALEILPQKPKRKSTPMNAHQLVKDARKLVQQITSEKDKSTNKEHADKLRTALSNLDSAYASAQAEYIQGKISEISHLHITKKHAAAWSAINELTGRKSRPSITIKGGSSSKRKENWLSHFRDLLGQAPKTPTNIPMPLNQIASGLNIPVGPFTLDELNEALKPLKHNKAPGLDNIPAMIWKDPIFNELLLSICNDVFLTFRAPDDWLTSCIIPVPKKGDLSNPGNYRGISLTSLAAKIYNRLILNRLLPKIDPLLRKNQNGFRKGRSTISQVLCLRRIIEEMRNHKKEVTICFVDFKKAFDSISRETLFKILPLYGIPDHMVNAIKTLYTNTKAIVNTPDGETESFDILAGVLQGDTLAPFIFILVLDYVLRISVDQNQALGLEIQPRRSSRHPAQYLTDLDFADDLAITSECVANAESLLHSLESAASCVGLYCNESKTEYITTSPSQSTLSSLSGKTLKQVDDFKYLGSYIMSSEKDFKIRKALAWKACHQLDTLWQSNMDEELKINYFLSTVEPVLLYGSETWTLTSKQQQRLDGTYTNMLRRVKNISWRDHATLNRIYGKLPRVSAKLTQRRVQFAGHCYRAEDEIISSLLFWKPSAPNRSNRLTYPDVIARDTGIQVQDLPVAMAHRSVWKSVVCSVSAEAAG